VRDLALVLGIYRTIISSYSEFCAYVIVTNNLYGKNSFVKVKIELDTDLKIILFGPQNNYIRLRSFSLLER